MAAALSPVNPVQVRDPRDGVPREEVRFAVVLNGGVSLAVWIGGAMHELNRLTYAVDGYAAVLAAACCTARADVLAGTSAGGINGAALALAQRNQLADLALLRNLWTDQGRLETLLRQPFRGSPTSLLQGDEYFLPKIHDALQGLAVPYEPSGRPVDLTITTTLLREARTVTRDYLGQRLFQAVHGGRFRFRWPAGEAESPQRLVPALALAARCTAGYPIAFEPSFVPAVDRFGTTSDRSPIDRYRPDMGSYASWRGDGLLETDAADGSRYVVDGGVLANTPTREALRAVDDMSADGPVRRVMLLVHPHAADGCEATGEADKQATVPTVPETMVGLLRALTAEGGRSFFDEVERHNKLAEAWRGGRTDVLTRAGSIRNLYTLVNTAWGYYRARRIRASASHLVDRIPPVENWSRDRSRAAAQAAQEWWSESGRPLPYVPTQLPTSQDCWTPGDPSRWVWGATTAVGIADSAIDLLRRMVWMVDDQMLVNGTNALDAVKDARKTVHAARARLTEASRPIDDPWRTGPLSTVEPTRLYWQVRLAFYERAMLGTWHVDADNWCRELGGQQRPDVTAALDQLKERVDPRSAGITIACQVRKIIRAIAGVRPIFKALLDSDGPRTALAELRPWKVVFDADDAAKRETPLQDKGPDLGNLLRRMLALEVATWLVADEVTTGASRPVDLVQMSLQTQNHFAVYSKAGDDKVGGMSINRFGGFLKRSWRVNDWIWGRLDAATCLCQVVLDPLRLRRGALLANDVSPQTGCLVCGLDEASQPGPCLGCAALPAMTRCAHCRATGLVDALITRLYGLSLDQLPADGDGRQALVQLRRTAIREVCVVHRDDGGGGTSPIEMPSRFPALADLAAYAIQIRIIVEELPALAGAIRADRVEGANRQSRGEVFLAEHAELLRELETDRKPSLEQGFKALRAFDRAGIGREPLVEEATSDSMIRTAATAAAVVATIADSDTAGFTWAKPVTRTLRGGMLLPYWTIMGLTRGGVIARQLSLLALALGAVLLTLSLLAVLPSWASAPAAIVGLSAVLVAFGYAALRTGTVLHGLVLLTPVVPLLVYAVTEAQDADPKGASFAQASGAALLVLGLAVGLMVLGSIPTPLRTAWATMARLVSRVIVVLIVAAVIALAAILIGGPLWERIVDAWSWVAGRPRRDFVIATGLMIVIGAARAVRVERRFRPVGSDAVTDPAGVFVGWSIVYGLGATVVAWAFALIAPDLITREPWAASAFGMAVSMAVFLVLVVPFVLPLLAHRRLVAKLARLHLFSRPSGQGGNVDLAAELQRRGLAYDYLVREDAQGPTGLGLTRRGERVRNRLVQWSIIASAPEHRTGADRRGGRRV